MSSGLGEGNSVGRVRLDSDLRSDDGLWEEHTALPVNSFKVTNSVITPPRDLSSAASVELLMLDLPSTCQTAQSISEHC